jgi:FkbM family methyltransferase
MKYFIDLGSHYFEGLEEFIPKLSIDKNFSVYCYEANKNIYENSKKYVDKYKNLFFDFNHYNLAVTNYTGEIIFNSHKGAWKNNDKTEYINDYDYGSNCLNINPTYDAVCGVVFDIHQYNCQCIDINEIINSICKKDDEAEIYIKCDIEGSEFYVLPQLLKTEFINKIKEIHIEWHERFWSNTDEYSNKINEKNDILIKFKNLNITTFIHH